MPDTNGTGRPAGAGASAPTIHGAPRLRLAEAPAAQPAPSGARSPAAPTRPRLDALTGLRGLAAAVVFIPHAGLVLSGRPERVAELVGVPGSRALGFFFALSGFVLTWATRPGDTARGFWQRRFARIYPAYLVTLLAAVVVTGLVQRHPLPVGPFVATLFAVQAWFPHSRWYFSYNGVDWTIACEVFFYLVFPLFIRPLARLGRVGRRRLQVILLGSLSAFAVAAEVSGVGWLANQFPVARLPEFVLGCTLAIDIARDQVIAGRVRLRSAILVAGAAWLVSVLPVPFVGALPLLTVAMLLLLNAGAMADLAGRRSLLTRRPLVWFGEVSFCFYLVHQLVLKVVASLPIARLDLPGGGLVWAVLCFGLAIPVASALHRWVEIPGNALLRGRSRRRPSVTLQE